MVECLALALTDLAMPLNIGMAILLQIISNGKFICFATTRAGHVVGLSLVTVNLLPSTVVFTS